MRAWTLPIMILVVAATLGGCGQKGPLYRENPEASAGQYQTPQNDREPDGSF